MSGTTVWADSILEIEPSGTSGGTVVWAWYLWDHIVQDFDSSKDNYSGVADRPELVGVNFGPSKPDWTRINSVDHNAELDQLIVPVHNLSEIWNIEHNTPTA